LSKEQGESGKEHSANASQVVLAPTKVKLKKKRVRIRNKEPSSSFTDKFISLSLRATGRLPRSVARKMPNLREDILRSNLNISPEGVIAIAFFITFLTVPLVVLGMFLMIGLGLGLFSVFLPFVLPFPFILGTSIPKISASSRSQALEAEVPYLIGYITVLAGGGISPIVTLKRVSKSAGIFPAAAREAARILRDIEIFGLDAISALERAANYTPNRFFSEFLGGYVAVLNTGGDVLSYLETRLREVFAYREIKTRRGIEFIGTLAEAYIIATAVMGVAFTTLFATSNLMSTSQTVDPSLIILFSGIFIPIISVVFIMVLGGAMVREPYTFELPYYILLVCVPIIPALYFAPLGIAPYYALGAGLVAASLPGTIVQMRYMRSRKSVEARLASFLRDVSEIRKTGLAPEKTIEQLAGRNYAGLTRHVKQIAAQLSWGTPIRTVLTNFSKSVKSWVTRAMTFLLLEVVDVGGGSPKMFISLADFTEKNDELNKERKSAIRPFIIIPYIGAILVVATTAMIAAFATSTALNPSSLGIQSAGTGCGAACLPSASVAITLTNILVTGAVFQAWFMGLVAGKMGEGSTADGFKHGMFLVIISLITIAVAGPLLSSYL
jgi:archaeal flagellar protein FlaJ